MEQTKTNKETKDLFAWLETQNCSLINDRNGHWTVSYDGIQDHPKKGKVTCDIHARFFIPSYKWARSIRGAILAAKRRKQNE